MEHWVYLDSYFTDVNRTTINVVWQDGEEQIEETIPFDPEFHRYQELLKSVSLDQIHDNTKKRNKEGNKAFRQLVMKLAEEDGYIYLDNAENYNAAFKNINEYLFGEAFNPELDKELLFKIKLLAFEMEFIKEYKGRKLKSELRKATSVYDVYRILFQIKDEISN